MSGRRHHMPWGRILTMIGKVIKGLVDGLRDSNRYAPCDSYLNQRYFVVSLSPLPPTHHPYPEWEHDGFNFFSLIFVHYYPLLRVCVSAGGRCWTSWFGSDLPRAVVLPRSKALSGRIISSVPMMLAAGSVSSAISRRRPS